MPVARQSREGARPRPGESTRPHQYFFGAIASEKFLYAAYAGERSFASLRMTGRATVLCHPEELCSEGSVPRFRPCTAVERSLPFLSGELILWNWFLSFWS